MLLAILFRRFCNKTSMTLHTLGRLTFSPWKSSVCSRGIYKLFAACKSYQSVCHTDSFSNQASLGSSSRASCGSSGRGTTRSKEFLSTSDDSSPASLSPSSSMNIFGSSAVVSALNRRSKCNGNENDWRFYHWLIVGHRFSSLMKLFEGAISTTVSSPCHFLQRKCESMLPLFYQPINQSIQSEETVLCQKKLPRAILSQQICGELMTRRQVLR